jgi:Outer membrane protein beta-barrel domain
MRTFLVIAGLAMAGSAGAEGLDFYVMFGETLMNNGGLGTDLCTVGTANSLCQGTGATSNDVSLANGFHFGFRLGFNVGDHLGFETGYMYNRTKLQFNGPAAQEVAGVASEGMAYHQVAFNGLYYITPSDTRFRPFATGGLGFTNYAEPGTSAAYGGGSTELGFNYGVGVKIRLTSLFGMRVDVRQATTPKPFGFPLASGWLRENEFSVGFGVHF